MPRSTKPPAIKTQIARMVKRIVERFDPEKIILFGSQARGDAGPDSDVDLLVVMDVKGCRFEQGLKIHGALSGISVPVDIIVTTPGDFAWRKTWSARSSTRQRTKEGFSMPAPDPVVTVLREWIVKAENDLLTAVHTLKLGASCPTDTVCFHVQQCIEKYLKALLVFRAIPFSKTHDIGTLWTLVPPRLRPALGSKAQKARLTAYAVPLRYPGWGVVISSSEARHAVALARRVRRQVRRHLPAAALRCAETSAPSAVPSPPASDRLVPRQQPRRPATCICSLEHA